MDLPFSFSVYLLRSRALSSSFKIASKRLHSPTQKSNSCFLDLVHSIWSMDSIVDREQIDSISSLEYGCKFLFPSFVIACAHVCVCVVFEKYRLGFVSQLLCVVCSSSDSCVFIFLDWEEVLLHCSVQMNLFFLEARTHITSCLERERT